MTRGNNERLVIFKRECRKYFAYQAETARIAERLRSLQVTMENVHSPSMQKIGSSPSRKEFDLVRLMAAKDVYEKNKAFYERRVKWIDDVINAIPSKAYCAIAWMTLVQGKTRMEVIITYDASPDYVYKIRDQFLAKILADETVWAEFEKDEVDRPDDIKPARRKRNYT